VTEQFAAGRYAIAVASALRFARTQGQAQFGAENMFILPWPTYTAETSPGPMNVSGWWTTVWDGSPNKEAAALFVEHMVSPAGIELWSKVGGQVPIRTSVLQDPFFEQAENAHMQVVRESWSNWSWMEPTQCNTRTFQADLNEAVQRFIQDGVDPMTALEEAERKFREAQ
jgi:multiple sugar transport system substrate-binding protein